MHDEIVIYDCLPSYDMKHPQTHCRSLNEAQLWQIWQDGNIKWKNKIQF